MTRDGVPTPYIKIIFSTWTWQEWRICLGVSAVLLAWTWRNQVVGAFVDYMSHNEWAIVYPVAVVVVGGLLFSLTQTQREFLQSPASFTVILIAVIIVLITKLGLALVLARKLISLRSEAKTDIARACAIWVAASATAATGFGLLIATADSSGFYPGLKNPVNEIIAILLVPLARPIAARIALETGRHR
jgi:hypothetical protein